MLDLNQSQLTGWLQRPREIMDLEKVKACIKLVIVRLCFA